MITQLVNGRIFNGEQTLAGHTVLLEDAEIVDVVPAHQVTSSAQDVDLQGHILAPGLIDLQVNGGGGLLFNDDPTVATISGITAAHRATGTTSLLPTLMSDSPQTTATAIKAVARAIESHPGSVPGIHLEGPFLNPVRKGAHDADLFYEPDDASIELASSLATGRTLLTLAPERVGSEFIRRLVDAGIVVAAGHTAATYAEIRLALDAGLTGFTHLFNAMTQLGSREPGVVGAALEDPHSWCGVIADGAHVHWAALRLALAAKPRGKVFLVSDAMPVSASETSSFMLHGETVSSDNGYCMTADGTLAGSSLDLMTAVRNAVEHLYVSWEEATRMASLYPASFLGIENRYGKIAPGFKANLVLVDDALTVLRTWVHGSMN